MNELEELDVVEKIDAILSWAKNNETFDTKFVDKMREDHDVFGELSERQEQAIDNIIDRWNVPV